MEREQSGVESGEIPRADAFSYEVGLILTGLLLSFCNRGEYELAEQSDVYLTKRQVWERLANTGFAVLIRAIKTGWTLPALCGSNGMRSLWLLTDDLIRLRGIRAVCCDAVVVDIEEMACCACVDFKQPGWWAAKAVARGYIFESIKDFTLEPNEANQWAFAIFVMRHQLTTSGVRFATPPDAPGWRPVR